MPFNDSRNQAELLLAPRLPLSRSVVNFSSLKLNLGGTALPGVVSDPSQFSGPLRTSLGASITNKLAVEGLAGSINGILAHFDNQAIGLQNGSFVALDPMLIPATSGVPNVAVFFSFSTLAPGAPIPANFRVMIQTRKTQLQSLSKTFSASFSESSFGGVSIVENLNPSTYPLTSQLDLPSVPRLAQGGAAAQNDAILKDKIRFAVHGVPIGAGNPGIWGRLLDIATNPPLNLNPVVGQLFQNRKNQSTWSEPLAPYAAQFPYNRVQQSQSGHVIEIDDTPGAERVHIFHRSGSFIEFHPDGSVVYKSMKDGYVISMADHHVKVNGKCHVAVDGGVTVYCKGNIDVQSDGDINIHAKGDYNVWAKNINMRAKKTFKGDGTLIDLRYISLPAAILPIMAGVAFIGMAPRVNMTAVAEAFPDNTVLGTMSNFTPSMDPASAGAPTFDMGTTPTPPPPENPLSNFSVYVAQSPTAISYRAHLFDTPEETNDFEMYSAHTGLQQTLGDLSGDPRQFGGALRTIDTGLVAPASKPTVNYLNYDDFKGTYQYANGFVLGGTSFTVADVADVAIHSDFVSDATLSDFTEDVPTDVTTFAGPTSSSIPPTTMDGTDNPTFFTDVLLPDQQPTS